MGNTLNIHFWNNVWSLTCGLETFSGWWHKGYILLRAQPSPQPGNQAPESPALWNYFKPLRGMAERHAGRSAAWGRSRRWNRTISWSAPRPKRLPPVRSTWQRRVLVTTTHSTFKQHRLLFKYSTLENINNFSYLQNLVGKCVRFSKIVHSIV